MSTLFFVLLGLTIFFGTNVVLSRKFSPTHLVVDKNKAKLAMIDKLRDEYTNALIGSMYAANTSHSYFFYHALRAVHAYRKKLISK